MRFLTVDTIIKEIIESYTNAKDVYVSYILEDAKPDQFGKLTTYPMLLVIQEPGKKTVLKYEEMVDLFEDSIGLTLFKPNIITEGIACCKISTTPEHSHKFGIDFFPRKHIAVSENVVKTIYETKKNIKVRSIPEVLDI